MTQIMSTNIIILVVVVFPIRSMAHLPSDVTFIYKLLRFSLNGWDVINYIFTGFAIYLICLIVCFF